MPLTVIAFLAIAVIIGTLVTAYTGKPPLWVSVLLLGIIELLRVMPLGR